MLKMLGESSSVRQDSVKSLLAGRGINDWAALCRIRGAQIGALRAGWKIEFDIDAWFALRRSSTTLDDREVRLLNTVVDPFLPFLYAVARITAAPAARISQLRSDDLAIGRASVTVGADEMRIPVKLHDLARAYADAYIEGDRPGDALFKTVKGNRRLQPHEIRNKLLRAAREFGLASPRAAVATLGSADAALDCRLRRLEGRGVAA